MEFTKHFEKIEFENISRLSGSELQVTQVESMGQIESLQSGLEGLTTAIQGYVEDGRVRNPGILKVGDVGQKTFKSTENFVVAGIPTLNPSELKVSQVEIMGSLRDKQCKLDGLISTMEGYLQRNRAVDSARRVSRTEGYA